MRHEGDLNLAEAMQPGAGTEAVALPAPAAAVYLQPP